LFFELNAKIKIVARNNPRTPRDRVSWWKGSRGTYVNTSSIAADMYKRTKIGIEREHKIKQTRPHEGLNGGAFRSTFRLRFVTALAHMMLDDDTYARPRTDT